MPGFVIHLAVAKEYLKRHKDDQEDENEFYRGVIAPDLLKKPESHYGPSTSDPDIECYAKETDLSSSYERGYYLHLLTDKIFYLDYKDSFSEEFYHDYNKMNRRLIQRFQIQVPEEIKEIVEFEEGAPTVLRFTGLYNFIMDLAKGLKKLTDGPALIRNEIECLKARDWGWLRGMIQERELKKLFDLDNRMTEDELYADTIHEVRNEELFHQYIVTIRWKKFDEIRGYIKECQNEAFLKGSNEIFEAIVHVMYLHHIMNCTGTRGVLEETDKLSKAPYGEFLISMVGLMKSGKTKSDVMDEVFAMYEAYSRDALRDYILHIYIVCMFLAYDNKYCNMNKLEKRFDMYRQFIIEKYKTDFQAFLLKCAKDRRGDFGGTSKALMHKLANEGYAPACYEYAIRIMPKCAPYYLDDYGEETTEYYDDCRIAEAYFQKARDGGIDC